MTLMINNPGGHGAERGRQARHIPYGHNLRRVVLAYHKRTNRNAKCLGGSAPDTFNAQSAYLTGLAQVQSIVLKLIFRPNSFARSSRALDAAEIADAAELLGPPLRARGPQARARHGVGN